jgi:hypothetical protein
VVLGVNSGLIMPPLAMPGKSGHYVLKLGIVLAWTSILHVDEEVAPAIAHVTFGAWVLAHPLNDWRRQLVSLSPGGILFSTEKWRRRAVVYELQRAD